MSQVRASRRKFLKKSAGIVAAGAMTPYLWTSRTAVAEDKNSRLNVASIGVGGRGSEIGNQAASMGNMVACCDVDKNHAQAFANGKKDCKIYGDFRDVLARKDIDAVTIGTPDHWHVAIAMAAMKAGKDVYCEKPLTLTIDEGKQICQMVKQTGRVFQVGTQQRSEYGSMFLKAVAIARSGRLGTKLKATASVGNAQSGGPFAEMAPPPELNWEMWLGQAPLVNYIPQRCHANFRWWLEYSGGEVTDWGVHHTDIACWALGVDHTGPQTVEGTGKFDPRKNCYNVAPSFDCTMQFANGNTIRLNSFGNDLLIEGDKARISVNRGHLNGKPIEDMAKSKEDQKWLNEEVLKLYRGKQPGSHMGNFFACVKSRELPISDVYTHHRSVSNCHLANIAMRLGRKLTWDPDKQDFVNDAAASAMLSRQQRQGYTLKELVG